ncbi:MAG TPA: hypothetical protein VL137_03040, partial [Polyangiaceae bacterium]|nr:hypothetical protein [Polyangiaceae bacterium]
MVNPHDKTVLARDLQIPEELEDAPILDGDIVVPDFDDAAPQPELERLSIPELERISIPTLHADTERPPAPQVPPQAAVPDLAPVPSLPAGPRRPPSSAGGRAAASSPQANAVDSLGPPAPRSKPRPMQGPVQGPVEFDDEFESFNAEGLTGVQAQLLETVQVREDQSQLPWPTGNSPDYQAIMIDPVDARVRGNFGAVPQSPVQAPQYAIAVFRRVRELKAELAATKARSVAAEKR